MSVNLDSILSIISVRNVHLVNHMISTNGSVEYNVSPMKSITSIQANVIVLRDTTLFRVFVQDVKINKHMIHTLRHVG